MARIKDIEESVKLRNMEIGDLEQKIGEFKSFTETQLREQQGLLESANKQLEEEIREKEIYKQQVSVCFFFSFVLLVFRQET